LLRYPLFAMLNQESVRIEAGEEMQKTKRQHTVPRFYLARWIPPGAKNIWTFDKLQQKTFSTSLRNVAQAGHFYDLPTHAIKSENQARVIDPQAVEKALASMEGEFARTLDALLGFGKPNGIPSNLKEVLAFQVVIQWMRTTRYRHVLVEVNTKVVQALVDDLIRRNYPEGHVGGFTVTLEDQSIPILHNQFFFDPSNWRELAWVLFNHIWLLAVNDTSIPFYVSDSPVIRRANLPDDGTGVIGIDSPGVEFFMPVSPEFGILICERTYFNNLERSDGESVWIDSEQVKALNRIQVEQSHRQIFSLTDDFTTARQVCEENPLVCDPTRQSVEVRTTETSVMSTRLDVCVEP